MTPRVAITGVGAVTPLGVGAEALVDRWVAGECGIANGEGRCDAFEPTDHLKDRFATECRQIRVTIRRQAWNLEPHIRGKDTTRTAAELGSKQRNQIDLNLYVCRTCPAHRQHVALPVFVLDFGGVL